MQDTEFTLDIDLDSGYAQDVDFDHGSVPGLTIDEPAPLGKGSGPSPVRLVGAAVGSCLGASLLYCLRRARVHVFDLHTTVRGTLVRNAGGRVRIGSMEVRIEPIVAPENFDRVRKCATVFEDYCVVTATLRAAFPIATRVVPKAPPEFAAPLCDAGDYFDGHGAEPSEVEAATA